MKRCELYGLHIYGYCLMTNHVHLVAIPENIDSLQNAIGYSHRLYAQKSNRRHGRHGHLWEFRFYSCPLDESHFIKALIYVDRNPVRAGLVNNPMLYKWSSSKTHAGDEDFTGLIALDNWRKFATDYDWDAMVMIDQEQEIIEEIRKCTFSGQPWGSVL